MSRLPFRPVLTRPCVSMLCVATGLFVVSPSVVACTVCFGDPDSSLTHGARWGIVTMLFITYGLLVGMAAMLGYVMIRASRRHAAAKAAEAEYGSPIDDVVIP